MIYKIRIGLYYLLNAIIISIIFICDIIIDSLIIIILSPITIFMDLVKMIHPKNEEKFDLTKELFKWFFLFMTKDYYEIIKGEIQ